MAAVTICSEFGAPQIKSLAVSIVFPSICHEVMGPDALILIFWMLSFKPTFSLPRFTFIKRLFSYSSLFAIRMVSSAYLRLFIFLSAILIPGCASSSLAFCIMYSAYKLNKHLTHYSIATFWLSSRFTDFRSHENKNFILNPLCANAKHNDWSIEFVE